MSRNVIVTGGSRGLGLAIVRRLICDRYRRSDSVTGTVLTVDAGSTA